MLLQTQNQKIAASGSSYMKFAAQQPHSQDERKLGCSS